MTELIWDGKYGKDGKKVAPLRVSLPIQDVETVNESTADRGRNLDLFTSGKPTPWRNRLIWGDKKYVLPALLDEFAGKVNLIYIDPPFATGADFSFSASIPDGDESFTKEPSVIEQKAYRDTWGRGLDSYLQWFYETMGLLRELLAANGTIYVHLDWHVSHYAKVILDELLGADSFVNEVIWRRKQATSWVTNQFGVTNDTLLIYVGGPDYVFNPEYSKDNENTQDYIRERFVHDDGDGRKYMKSPLVNPLNRPNLRYEFHGVQPPPTGWLYSRERLEYMYARNELVMPKAEGGRIYRKIYLDEYKGQIVQNIWTDIPIVNPMARERLNFPTQKPEALLERIAKVSSNEGDLVLDCFVGSGTTAAVAEKLNRRWIACDLGRFAIHTTRKRLLEIPNVKPFIVQNLGKYERQQWQVGEFGEGNGVEAAAARQRAYVDFVLKLYNARPLNGHAWLHGVRNGHFVHVGGVDAPVSVGDVQCIAAEFRKIMGSGAGAPTTNAVDVLGWDFAFELNEVAKQHAAAANIAMKFVRIPHDVMDKRAVEQGDIKFFELAALDVGVTMKKEREVEITLKNFVMPPDDVPEDVRKAVKSWDQWVDYWAIDWDFKGDAFHNEWQTYRTRSNTKLQKVIEHTYDASGDYAIVVKVIDILGNDTTKRLDITVKG